MGQKNSLSVNMQRAADLRVAYEHERPRALRLAEYVSQQLSSIISHNEIALGVPMESRVKQWSSIESKISRKKISLETILDLNDLVGVRAITLFRRDESSLIKLVESNFDVISREDTGDRLEDSQFGYQSQHFIAKLKKEWVAAPTVSDLSGLQFEIQVRTIAQHIWAAASHKLQYKFEDSVPFSLRRSIYRASALLETVDLEFERILDERKEYIDRKTKNQYVDDKLDVELVDIIAREKFPRINADDDEDFEAVLAELKEFDINTVGELEAMIDKHYANIMKADKLALSHHGQDDMTDQERTARGVFYNLIGLLRQALVEEFGEAKVRAAIRSDDGPL